MLKGGIIGFGTSGREFTDYINKHCTRARIVAACNRGQANLDAAVKEYGLRGTHSVEEMCSWDLDFVMVVSTSYAHCAQVVEAAKHGLHVFCEKPIALNLDDARKMIEAVEKAGVCSVVNYSRRYEERIHALRRFMQQGDLGDILSFTFQHGRAFGLSAGGARHRAIQEPEESGGWIVHHTCHQLDLLYYLFGEFKEIYCTTKTTVQGKDSEEVIFGSGRMKNGVMFHISDSLAKVRYDHMVAVGTKASYAWQNVDHFAFDRVREEKCAADNVFGFDYGWYTSRGDDEPSVEHFLDVIEGKAKPVADLRSSYESLRAAIAMKQFANSGKVVDMESYGK
jgi:predicted dehydrogenase